MQRLHYFSLIIKDFENLSSINVPNIVRVPPSIFISFQLYSYTALLEHVDLGSRRASVFLNGPSYQSYQSHQMGI